jgi:hypothetical protein
VPYLLLGLQDVQRAVENSRGARKLARTPHVNQKKKKTKKKLRVGDGCEMIIKIINFINIILVVSIIFTAIL